MTSAGIRFVLLTAGDANGRRLAVDLKKENIPFDLVTMSFAPPRRRPSRSALAHLLAVLKAHFKNIQLVRRFAHRHRQPYPQQPRYAGFCNGKKLLRILEGLRPDYIIMMGGGILSDAVIRTARKGVLNAHPGLLPWVRGVDVIAGAVLKGIAPGITCHFIDAGIDTGPTIDRYLLPVRMGDSLEDLQARANLLNCAVMLEVVKRLHGGEAIPGTVQTAKFPLYRRLGAEDLGLARAAIAKAKALELYERWKAERPEILDGALLLDSGPAGPSADGPD